MFLPRTEASPEETRTPPSPQETLRGPATILLVEDNLGVCKLIRDVLTGLGYSVLEAANAEEAIRAAENHPEVIDYVSGYADHDTAKRVLGDPNVAYLQKPFAPAELARKVAEMI